MTKMNVVIAAMALCFAAIDGCTHTTGTGPIGGEVIGSWQWVSTTGGIAGRTWTTDSAGYTIRIIFRPDGVYQEFRSGLLVRTEGYTLSREETPFHSGLSVVVHYMGTDKPPQEVTLAGTDTLRLADIFMDGFFSTYSRTRSSF